MSQVSEYAPSDQRKMPMFGNVPARQTGRSGQMDVHFARIAVNPLDAKGSRLPSTHVWVRSDVREPDAFDVLCFAQRLKELDGVAPQPVTSRESCSWRQTVPLRRRREMVLATSERGSSTAGAMPLIGLKADQLADIGNDPRGAGLNELIVVELVEIGGKVSRTARQ